MRFSLRDLLWLTTVVAIAVSLYTTHALMAKQARRWADEKSQMQQRSVLAHEAAAMKLDSLRAQNAMLSHQLTTQLQQSLARDQELDAERKKSATLYRLLQQGKSAERAPAASLDAEQ